MFLRKKNCLLQIFILCLTACLQSGCVLPGAGEKQETDGAYQDNIIYGEPLDDIETENRTPDSTSELLPTLTPAPTPETTPEPFTLRLGFAGDINLDENWGTTQSMDARENGIYDCIDQDLIEELNALDIFMLNNEFTYSDRGTPMEKKAYTFRAKPECVEVVKSLGTDIVLLANNHIFDYGKDAFFDTLDVLEGAGIPYVGAGRNLEEACTPYYFEYEGVRIAYVAATRAEKYKLTPQATEDAPGVLRCYDEELFLQVIAETAAEADYVVASVHFGTEYSNEADESQRELAYAMIDAGADAVIGSHAHVLQGMEFYKDKPIIYNLGNFWFNEKKLYSCVVELELSVQPACNRYNASGAGTESLEEKTNEQPASVTLERLRFLPCMQKNYYTSWEQEGDLRKEILAFEEDISFGVTIDEEGIVHY